MCGTIASGFGRRETKDTTKSCTVRIILGADSSSIFFPPVFFFWGSGGAAWDSLSRPGQSNYEGKSIPSIPKFEPENNTLTKAATAGP